MASDRKTVKYMLPTGIAIFPRLNEPDKKFKKEGEYSAKVRLSPDVFPADLLASLEALLEEKRQEVIADLTAKKHGAKIKSLSVRPILTPETDKESGEETGFVLVNSKMKASGVTKAGKAWTREPRIFDSKGKRLTNVPSIWGGSEIKVAGEAFAYYAAKENEVGISFQLEAVQIIKLVSGKERSASDYGFGEEEGGYADTSEFDDTTAAGGDTASAGAAPKSGSEF